ncbi:MAG: DotU family type IV/VI secretion system protein [Nitrospirae bacterium]|nr:DotU family type IV/VI secretion system protein [Nitrospirota bacterium]
MHLTDCFMDIVAYVVYFQKSAQIKQPPYEQVKADITRLLSESEQCIQKGSYSQEDYNQAKFMICAWVDETILASNWNQKNNWQKEQLQRIYYNTTGAGEEVFERLNNLGLHQREVREVYYLCLTLGFKGRYCKEGDDFLLEQLKVSNLKFLMGSSVGLLSLDRGDLFPEAYPQQAAEITPQKQKFNFSLLTISGIAAPVILFGLLFLIYHFTLSGVSENIIKAVP